MLVFPKAQTLFIDGIEYEVIHTNAESEALLENKATGERIKEHLDSLLEKYVAGRVLTKTQAQQLRPTAASRAEAPARMDRLTVRAKKETHRRIDYLVRLEKLGAFNGTRQALRDAIASVAESRHDELSPHESTIYRWKRKYLKARKDVKALFVRFDERGGRGQSRLDKWVENKLQQLIEEFPLTQRRYAADDVFQPLMMAVENENKMRAAECQLKMPSLRTIQRRLAMVPAFDLTVAAASLKEAERRFALHGRSRGVGRILELVEIDHTQVDLMVCDDDREPVGKPEATFVLDRASRCILGYHLSMAGHGVPAAFEALRHALLPKTYLKGAYSDLNLAWPCFGWFDKILMDNAVEFHARALVEALLNLGIISEFAEQREPNDKPHIERLIRTFNYSFIHKLPGTTLDKAHKRVGYKPEDDAMFTLAELDRLIHVWICNKYHLQPHKGLDGRAPLAVWLESAKQYPPQLKENAQNVDIEFSELTESSLQHYGIDLNNFVYSSERLLTLRRMLPPAQKVKVRWPRNDVGYVWIWDPIAAEFFKVPNKRTDYAGLTLDQARSARIEKSASDPDDALKRASVSIYVKEQIEEASQSKRLAVRRRGQRLANNTSKKSRHGAKGATSGESAIPPEVEQAKPELKVDCPIREIVIELPILEEEQM